MPEEQSTLVFLYEQYQKTVAQIRANRKVEVEKEAENKKLQVQMKQIKDSINELLDTLIRQEGSLYAVCKKNFGKIDKRFYRICSMLGRKY